MAAPGNDSVGSGAIAATGRRGQRRTSAFNHSITFARSLLNSFLHRPDDVAADILRHHFDFHGLAAPAASARQDDHYLRFSAGDVRFDAILYQRRHQGLLVSPAVPKHGFWTFH